MTAATARRLLCGLVVGCLLLQSVAMLGVAVEHPERAATSAPVVAQQATPTNNTTVTRHENPDSVQDDRDGGRVQAYLTGQLSERLSRSSLELTQSQYERARTLLGDEYNQSLEKLVDVAGETGDRQLVASFQKSQSTQRQFVASVQRYRETYAAYERAKQAGNEQRARRLARELDRIARSVDREGDTLVRTYARIENRSAVELDNATARINDTRQSIVRQQATVQALEFVNTTLTLAASDRTASVLDPVRVRGRLVTTNGTPVANQSITLVVAGQRRPVTTDGAGRFLVVYRPRTAPLSMTRLAVRYLPAETSVYFGASASVPIRIQQTTATLTIAENTHTAAYRERVSVRGSLTAANTTVSRVPVRFTVAGVPLGVVRTGPNGTFRIASTLPARVPNGTGQLAVSVAQTDRAVTAQPRTRSIRILTTETSLSVAAAERTGEIVVTGRLRDATGDPLPQQSVEIRVNDTARTIVETNASGWYRATIAPPAGDRPRDLEIRAVFDPAGTNLARSQATTRLTLTASQGGTDSRPSLAARLLDRAPVPLILGGGALLIAVVGLYLRRRDTESSPPGDAPSAPAVTDRTAAPFDRSLQAARERLESDPNAAVETAYAAIRRALANELSTTDAATHWEFYRTCTAADAALDAESLRTLTQLYEQAAYSSTGTDSTTARRALDLAETLSAQLDAR